jgi:cytochrome c2
MKYVRIFLLSLSIALATPLIAQSDPKSKESMWSTANLEFAGGYVHTTGDNGLNGFNVGTALWFNRRVSISVDYDYSRNTTSLSNFGLTTVGLITTQSHLQNFVVGPRVFFPSTKLTFKKFKLDPFAEFQFGFGHLNQKVSQVGVGSVSASDTASSWLLGGGVDSVVSPHWALRANLDLLRTHFANAGQSRFRLVLGVDYTFRKRKFSP